MSQPPLPIEWTHTARRSLARLPEKIATAAVEFIYGALAENPQRVGKSLRNELAGLHSARRGSYRIVYRITDVVTIMAIDHRAEIYHAH
ncbi:MAG: type II toxin-antitoxin system RelE/ParE family toxin [Actinobacteria bacterium]|jgi:mRNA-degrading endonuclease RelE of RelBE toxin-antitoxin system|nr:type II toxin-antitoxin system RelE/ParE family toxin [Actinomycetota bacterium]